MRTLPFQTTSRASRRMALLGVTASLTFLATACGEDDPIVATEPSIAELASTTPQLSTLTAALAAADLVATLEGPGPFTVFAPVDAAFDALGTQRIARLLDPANGDLLEKLLTYHVVPGEILAADLSTGASVTTVQGTSLTFDLTNGARVNGVRIVATDIQAGNGVVHLVESVLTQHLDLIDVATVEGFGTLVGAVRAAGLEATLRTDNGGAGFTVFAPTNAAFAAVGALPTDPTALSQILLYHGVGARVPSSALTNNQIVQTLQGGTFRVDLTGGVFLRGARNDATVVLADVAASNGIIHVIDAVLLP